MEDQKKKLDNTAIQPCKFKTRNWIYVNDKSLGIYNKHKQIIFKTSILQSSLCDYSNACILVKGTITVENTAAAVQQ